MGRKRGRSSNNDVAWTGADHAIRREQSLHRRQRQQQQHDEDEPARNERDIKLARREQRRAVLSHDTKEKRNGLKIQLHITKTQREIDQLRNRLKAWDDKDEENTRKEREAKAAAAELAEADQDHLGPNKKRGRLGPESWKLKGAAKPAHLVYDFDTRYVDPHAEAHKTAAEKAKRCQNILVLYKGRLGEISQEGNASVSLALRSAARQFLGLLMQLGYLCQEAKQYKTARAAWLECMELEGNGQLVTTARESLMRMYLSLERHEAAYRLGERLLMPDNKSDKAITNVASSSSVWLQYSFALMSLRLKKKNADEQVCRAIQINPFCAYYLAFYDTFSSVMEYTHDLEEAEDEPESSLEEAIEYCCCSSNQPKSWSMVPGALEILRETLRKAIKGDHRSLTREDVACEPRLAKIEEEFKARVANAALDADDADAQEEGGEEENNEEDSHNQGPDVLMYAGMFRTAIEMLKEAGKIP